jgi:hypothetical protein
VEAASWPYVTRLLADFPRVEIRNFPTVDNVPSLLTGVPPHEHGVWGPKLVTPTVSAGWSTRLVDSVPDLVTTTAQCAVHVLRGPVELATMPPRRRRRFELRRFKFIKYGASDRVSGPIAGFPSFLSVPGPGRCRFVFEPRLDGLDRAVSELVEADLAIEMIEVHGFDESLHWMMGDEPETRDYSRQVDDFIAALHRKCIHANRSFALLSDHGMEPVVGSIDMRPVLDALNDLDEEADYFVENTRAAFWLRTDRARRSVLELLEGLENGTVLPWRDLAEYGIHFQEAAYGDIYFYADAGFSLFPTDFHHPLANLVQSLVDPAHRTRFRRPRRRGDHGYLSENAAERGFMLVAEQGFEPLEEVIPITDVAPTLLHLIGLTPADTMRGRAGFRGPRVLA